MPARNLPPLGGVHETNGKLIVTATASDNNRSEMNVVQMYEESGGGGYHYSRTREYSSGNGTEFVVLENETNALSKALHLPAVNSTPSATSNKSRGIGLDALASINTSTRNVAVSPDTALQRFAHQMSSYEHREIFNYSNVYFIGPSAVKRAGVAGAPNNDGYDDDQGSYIQVCTLVE